MPYNIDSDLTNADWPKRTWDLLDITSVEQLREQLEVDGISVEAFKSTPTYQFNKDKIDWLKDL